MEMVTWNIRPHFRQLQVEWWKSWPRNPIAEQVVAASATRAQEQEFALAGWMDYLT